MPPPIPSLATTTATTDDALTSVLSARSYLHPSSGRDDSEMPLEEPKKKSPPSNKQWMRLVDNKNISRQVRFLFLLFSLFILFYFYFILFYSFFFFFFFFFLKTKGKGMISYKF